MFASPIRFAIVEDQRILADALALWVAHRFGYVCAGIAVDGEAGWTLCQRTQPDLVFLDLGLPDLDGLELAERLAQHFPAMRLLVLSGQMDAYAVWRVSQSRVHGYLEKSADSTQLQEAVPTVMNGGYYFSPAFRQIQAEWLTRPEAFQKILSHREQEVLRLVSGGWDDARIGCTLGITVETVATHRKHIRGKLGVHGDRELLAYAERWGLHPDPPQRLTLVGPSEPAG